MTDKECTLMSGLQWDAIGVWAALRAIEALMADDGDGDKGGLKAAAAYRLAHEARERADALARDLDVVVFTQKAGNGRAKAA